MYVRTSVLIKAASCVREGHSVKEETTNEIKNKKEHQTDNSDSDEVRSTYTHIQWLSGVSKRGRGQPCLSRRGRAGSQEDSARTPRTPATAGG